MERVGGVGGRDDLEVRVVAESATQVSRVACLRSLLDEERAYCAVDGQVPNSSGSVACNGTFRLWECGCCSLVSSDASSSAFFGGRDKTP